MNLPASNGGNLEDEITSRRTHLRKVEYLNSLCGGKCLDDLEFRRKDEGYLNAIRALRIPDSTTARNFCRRFESIATRSASTWRSKPCAIA